MALKIDHRKSGTVAVMDLSGKITLGEAANRLLETTKELLSLGERNLLYNLAEVAYVDSSGLGILVKCHNTAKGSQGRIKLVNVSRNIRDLLRITKLESLFEMFDDEPAAINSYI